MHCSRTRAQSPPRRAATSCRARECAATAPLPPRAADASPTRRMREPPAAVGDSACDARSAEVPADAYSYTSESLRFGLVRVLAAAIRQVINWPIVRPRPRSLPPATILDSMGCEMIIIPPDPHGLVFPVLSEVCARFFANASGGISELNSPVGDFENRDPMVQCRAPSHHRQRGNRLAKFFERTQVFRVRVYSVLDKALANCGGEFIGIRSCVATASREQRYLTFLALTPSLRRMVTADAGPQV